MLWLWGIALLHPSAGYPQGGLVGGWQCSGRAAPSFTKGEILVTGSGEGRGIFLSDVGESVLSVMDSHCDSL